MAERWYGSRTRRRCGSHVAQPGSGQRECLAHGPGHDQPLPAGQQRQCAWRPVVCELVVRLIHNDDGLACFTCLVHGLHDIQPQPGPRGIVGRTEENDVGLQFLDLPSCGFGAEAVAFGAFTDDIFGVRSAGQQRIHGVRGRKAESCASGTAKGLEDLLEHLIRAVRGPEVGLIQAVAQVFRQRFAQFRELPVRVAVQARGGFGYRRADGRPHVRRDTMGILVDVQEDGDVQLWRTVGGKPAEVAAEGKPVQAF
jgi:hypothetical protein